MYEPVLEAQTRLSGLERCGVKRGAAGEAASWVLTGSEPGATVAHPLRRLGAVATTRISRPVEIPDDLGDASGVLVTGRVTLPLHVAWSAQGEYDMSNADQMRSVYELVMTEGTEDDVRRFIDLDRLLDVWEDLWLPPHVRERWTTWLQGRGLLA